MRPVQIVDVGIDPKEARRERPRPYFSPGAREQRTALRP
jgi:hypothetical protein